MLPILFTTVRRHSHIIIIMTIFVALLLSWEFLVCQPVDSKHNLLNAAPDTCNGHAFYLISKPSAIIDRLRSGSFAWEHLYTTSANTLVNSLLALVAVMLYSIAWLMIGIRYEIASKLGYGLVWSLQVIPFVAFAWVLVIFFGKWDKVVFGFIVGVFPVLGALRYGIRNVSAEDREIMTLHAASYSIKLIHLFAPRAVGSFFGGMHLAAPLCVVGVLIADYSGGPRAGLGLDIFRTARTGGSVELPIFAIAALCISLLLYNSVRIAEHVFARQHPWYRKEQSHEWA